MSRAILWCGNTPSTKNRVDRMSQNCKSTYSVATTRDANNNTLYHTGMAQGFTGRGYTPPAFAPSGGYQQVTAKVLIGSMAAINDLKVKETAEREARRTH